MVIHPALAVRCHRAGLDVTAVPAATITMADMGGR
jgi:hypothetical protein